MKKYSKPVTETIDIQALNCFMENAGSGEHGEINFAPKKKKYIFF